MEYTWKIEKENLQDAGFAISKYVNSVAREQMPDMVEFFPFEGRWHLNGYFEDNWFCFRMKNLPGFGVPCIGTLADQEIECIKKCKFSVVDSVSCRDIDRKLGSEWISSENFTYVGSYSKPHACWQNLCECIIEWLNLYVIPKIIENNSSRVLRAIPTPPSYDIDLIRKASWILECEGSGKQGTAFFLKDYGLITCQHVLGPKTKAFQVTDLNNKYPVSVVSANADIDLAILNIDFDHKNGLLIGNSDSLKEMDHILITGYPNYRLGDTGIITPGLIVGFRPQSGVRRLLTNAPIVAGNSGGPVIAENSMVIGVAVTGADLMESVQNTENHGIIPIETLKFISS